MTLLEATKRNLAIQYTAIEAYPISMEQATALNYSTLLNNKSSQAHFLQMHSSKWATPLTITEQFQFIKQQIKFEAIDFENQFDMMVLRQHKTSP